MKKSLALFLILIMITLVGCTSSEMSSLYVEDEKAVGQYSSKDGVIPEKVFKSNDTYYALLQSYAGDEAYKIAVGPDFENLKTVYKSNEKENVWFMDADGDIAAWTELSETDKQEVKVYDRNSGEIKTLYTDDGECICQNVKVYNGSVYFVKKNTAKKEAYIVRYDTQKKAIQPILKTKTKITESGDCSINCFNVNYGCLVYAYSELGMSIIKCIDIDETDDFEYKSRKAMLSKSDATYVYAVAYDKETECIGVYCEGTDGSGTMGYIDSDDSGLWVFDYFSEELYAYRDQIECCDGVLLYVEQVNASGDIMDHYSLEGYEFETEQSITGIPSVYSITIKDSILLTQWVEGTKKCKVYKGTIKNANEEDKETEYEAQNI